MHIHKYTPWKDEATKEVYDADYPPPHNPPINTILVQIKECVKCHKKQSRRVKF